MSAAAINILEENKLNIRPLSAALGAEISGLDLTEPLGAGQLEAVQAAFLEFHLLCFRGPVLEPEAFAMVARYFGEPQRQLLRNQRIDAVPEVSVLESTYHSTDDKPDDLSLVRLSGWHTDDSYFQVPAKATMLQMMIGPSSGGETRFCNMRKAYEDLDDVMKTRIEGLRAVHSYDTARAPARALSRTNVEKQETPDVVHPLVRTHEESGRKAIYFNSNRTDRIEGLDRNESDALLDELHAHTTQAKYRYDHKWHHGDILLWDNRCLIHSVNTDFPVGEKRIHQRILLKGTRPV